MISNKHFNLNLDGTANKLCYCKHPELIENYDKAIADDIQIWDCHHRLETHNSDGERRLVDLAAEELTALGMYFDRPPEELIFLTNKEHSTLHNKDKRKSETHRQRISKSKKGSVYLTRRVYYKCVETGEIHHSGEWKQLGYLADRVASGKQENSRGLHFIKV